MTANQLWKPPRLVVIKARCSPVHLQVCILHPNEKKYQLVYVKGSLLEWLRLLAIGPKLKIDDPQESACRSSSVEASHRGSSGACRWTCWKSNCSSGEAKPGTPKQLLKQILSGWKLMAGELLARLSIYWTLELM